MGPKQSLFHGNFASLRSPLNDGACPVRSNGSWTCLNDARKREKEVKSRIEARIVEYLMEGNLEQEEFDLQEAIASCNSQRGVQFFIVMYRSTLID